MFFKFNSLKAIVLLIALMTYLCTASFPDDQKPINVYSDSLEYSVFRGSACEDLEEVEGQKLHSLQGLLKIGRNFYIYSRNHIFVLDAKCQVCDESKNIPFKQIIEWKSSADDSSLCIQKGQEFQDCQNFIKIFEEESNNEDPSRRQVIACGTNSFNPKCRVYQLSVEGKLLDMNQPLKGNLMCPFGPRESSASLVADGNLYTATVGGFGRQDALVLRSPRSSSLMRLRTKRSEKAMLNDPNFVRFVDGGNSLNKVFIFLTEWAIEDDFKAIYSRVGQVCKNDQGGTNLLRSAFSSFFKVRLNCSLPGQPPFYFNEMRDVTDLVILNSWYGYGNKKMVFAIMNTPKNSVPASAICVFSLDDIDQAMNGPFLEKYTRPGGERVYWEKLKNTPEPHLARCDDDPRQLSHENLNFASKHPLMHDSVSAWDLKNVAREGASPIFTRTRNFLTTITVDTNAGLTPIYTVLFAGTEDGKILKILVLEDGETVLLEERMIFNSKQCGNTTSRSVKKVLLDEASGKMMVAFDNCVVRAPLCPMKGKDCKKDCVGARDPYCAWDDKSCVMVDNQYVYANNTQADKSKMLQDVREGNTEGMLGCLSSQDKDAALKDSRAEVTTMISNTTSSLNASLPFAAAFPTPRSEISFAQMSPMYLILVGVGCIVLGFLCGCALLWFLRKKHIFSENAKYKKPSNIVTTATYNESEKPNDRRYSNQSMKSRNRNTSTSSQPNNHQTRNSSNGEQKRNRTETESSQGNKSDTDAVFTRSISNEGQHEENVHENDDVDALRRNKLQSTSGSINGKKQAKNSKELAESNNENAEQPSPKKHHPLLTPSDPRKIIKGEDENLIPQVLYMSSRNGVTGHLNPREVYVDQIGSPVHCQSNRTIPNRSVSLKEQPKVMTSQPRAHGTGNRGGKGPGVVRQMSLQMPNNVQPVFMVRPSGFYSPQVKPSDWQPYLQEEAPSTPNNKANNRKMPEMMIHSLDRRNHKKQKFSAAQPEMLEGIQAMPPTNGQPLRKRYASESEKMLRHPTSRAPPYQAIHEEQGPLISHPYGQDLQAKKQTLSLDLQQNSVLPGKHPMANPKVAALGRGMATSQSTGSNPGTPSGEMPPPFGGFTPPIHQQGHMLSEPVFSSDGMEKISPTRSNPPTPMHEGRMPNFLEDRRRHFSGQNYPVQQLPSPTKTVNPFFPNQQNLQMSHSKRNRNHSGGNNRGPMVPVTAIPIGDYVPITTSNGQPMTVTTPLIPPT